MVFKMLMLLGLVYLDSKGATLGCIRSLLDAAELFCGLDHSFEENTMFWMCCHRAAPLPAQRSYLSARSILAQGWGQSHSWGC